MIAALLGFSGLTHPNSTPENPVIQRILEEGRVLSVEQFHVVLPKEPGYFVVTPIENHSFNFNNISVQFSQCAPATKRETLVKEIPFKNVYDKIIKHEAPSYFSCTPEFHVILMHVDSVTQKQEKINLSQICHIYWISADKLNIKSNDIFLYLRKKFGTHDKKIVIRGAVGVTIFALGCLGIRHIMNQKQEKRDSDTNTKTNDTNTQIPDPNHTPSIVPPPVRTDEERCTSIIDASKIMQQKNLIAVEDGLPTLPQSDALTLLDYWEKNHEDYLLISNKIDKLSLDEIDNSTAAILQYFDATERFNNIFKSPKKLFDSLYDPSDEVLVKRLTKCGEEFFKNKYYPLNNDALRDRTVWIKSTLISGAGMSESTKVLLDIEYKVIEDILKISKTEGL
jgi:hypothetical protein